MIQFHSVVFPVLFTNFEIEMIHFFLCQPTNIEMIDVQVLNGFQNSLANLSDESFLRSDMKSVFAIKLCKKLAPKIS